MKQFNLFISLCILSSSVIAQGKWTWMSGDNKISQPGIYGVEGKADADNKPGSRKGSVSWTDESNNLWLFGGYGLDIRTPGFLNDLWKYNIKSNEWTWMSGDNTGNQSGEYGPKGVASAKFKPGARENAISWIDEKGSLWLYGGNGYTSGGFGLLNDLWRYQPSNGSWTWISGDNKPNQPPVYGTKSVAAAANKPGSRNGAVSWIDKTGNLWLYGGYGYDSTTKNYLNDLWKYNPSINQWTWISGDRFSDQFGVYGTKGVASSSTKPPGRTDAVSWIDAAGTLWLFSGYQFSVTGLQNYFNDLWKYNPSTNQWTWVNGDNVASKPGVYGTKGLPAAANKPGARQSAVSWADASGRLWLFGGYGYDIGNFGYLNDLWVYNPVTNLWEWASGDQFSNRTAVYGTKGVANVDNKPGGIASSASWMQAPATLWLFGGGFSEDSGLRNDLWKYEEAGLQCPSSLTTSTDLENCYGFIKNLDPVITPAGQDNVKYALTGATTGTGSGSVSGMKFFKGTTTVVYSLEKDANTTCRFTISLIDSSAPVPVIKNLPDIKAACAVTVTRPTAIDNCEGTKTGTTSDPLSYTAPGTYTINWSYSDANANKSTQKQTVIIKDSIAPVPKLSSLPDIYGECSVSSNSIPKPSATDNCSTATIFGSTKDPLSYSSQGTYTITWTYTDSSGNSATQKQLVIVKDTVAPAPKLDILPDVYGTCSATVTTVPTATDRCTGAILGTTKDSLLYKTQGTHIITWIYNDGNGNSATQTQRVILKDTSAPVPRITSLPDLIGQCSVVVSDKPTASQSCAGTIIATTSDPLSYTKQGTYTINWIYTGANGSKATQTQKVIVKDITAPKPLVDTLPDITGECSVVVVTRPTAMDNCSGTIGGVTTDSLSYNKIGTYIINWIYNDGNGNSSRQTQRVIVKTSSGSPSPVISNLPDITGECSVTVTTRPSATQNCAGNITATTNDPLSYNKQGTYIITWRYTGANESTVTQTQKVIVKDITAPKPMVDTLPDITGECSVTVAGRPTATDNCSGTIGGVTTDSLSYNKIGTYIINWFYNDGNGNSSRQTQRVIVKTSSGLPSPVVSNLPDIIGECSVNVTTRPSATQNCAGNITATTNDPLTYNKQGTYTITWRYTGANESTVTQTQKVIVKDITAPKPAMDTLPDITGECSVLVSNRPTATDNCSGVIGGVTTDTLSYNKTGTYTLNWIYNDGNGNSTRQTQRVIVKTSSGLPSPVVSNLPDITGECSVTVTTRPSATQNCAGNITATTNDPLSYNKQGTYIITWRYTGANESTVTQTQKVIVKDVTAPKPATDTLPDITGECSVLVSNRPTATDNCSGVIGGVTTDSLSYNKTGTYIINWTYNDGNGNSSKQSQRVIVKTSSGQPSPVVSNLPDITGECSVTVTTRPSATQNCAGNITATTNDPLTYNKQGTYTITWRYTGANESTVTQTQKVIVKDITAPKPAVDTLPDITGECSVIVSTRPTAMDNCSGTVTGVTTDSLSYNKTGTYIINWIYNDGNGNSSKQSQRVIVKTTSGLPSPVVSNLPDIIGECSITVTTRPSATQNCSGNITATTNDPLSYNKQGTYTITWRYTGANESTVTQTQKVIVKDITAPKPATDTLPDITGECSVLVSTRPTATDNCSGVIGGVTTDSLSYNKTGTYILNWIYNDGNGNSSRQTQRVIVKTSSGQPSPVVSNLPDITGECSVTVTTRPSATQNCAGNITATTNDPLTYNKQGMYTITWRYAGANESTVTQTQKVIVKDITAPIPNSETLPDITGECSVQVQSTPTATDNCAGNLTGTTQDPLSYSVKGSYIINWKYNDGNGNQTTQVQRVIVKSGSVTVPVGAALPDIIGQCSATVTARPTAAQSCGGTLTATTTDPLTYNTQGIYVINWVFNDGSPNGIIQQQRVIVKDATAPIASVPTLPDLTDECSVTVTARPTAIDNCAGTITATTNDPLVYSAQGNYTITWSYNDGNGNVTTQKQNVMIKDRTAPIPVATILPDIKGECTVIITNKPTATDKCGGTITATTSDPLVYTAQGVYTITWKFNDGNGNSTTQKQTVIVKNINLAVNAYPNPTSSQFTILVKSCNKDAVIGLRIFDVLGRIIYQNDKEIRVGLPYKIKQDFPIAFYFAEITQGKERVVLKLMKQ